MHRLAYSTKYGLLSNTSYLFLSFRPEFRTQEIKYNNTKKKRDCTIIVLKISNHEHTMSVSTVIA